MSKEALGRRIRRMAWKGNVCGPSVVFAESEGYDGQGNHRAEGHDDGGDERVHVPGESGGDGGEIVEEGESEGDADDAPTVFCEGEELGEKAQAVAEEVEIGFGFEQTAIDDGCPGGPGGVESERVVRSIAEVEGVVAVDEADETFLGFRLKAGMGVGFGNSEEAGGGGDFFGSISREDKEVVVFPE